MAEDLTRPYVGYRSAGRRPESQQDRRASADAPLAALRGLVSGVLGAPGDVESLVRMLPGLSEQTVLPTSEDVERRLPLRAVSETPVGRVATGAGQLGGGFYTGPGSPLRAVAALPSAVRRAARDFAVAAGQPAVNVVKPKGGNWLAGSIEREIAPMRTVDPAMMDVLRNADPRFVDQAALNRVNAEGIALDKWLETKLAKYIRNEMGTAEDPIRALAERGVLHYEPQGGAVRAHAHRSLADMPTDPTAVGPLARAWEDVADAAILPGSYAEHTPIGGFSEEALRKLGGEYAVKNPQATAYSMDIGTRAPDLGFGHLVDELRNAINPASGLPENLRWKYQDLEKVTVPQAVQRVADINAWRAAQKAEADLARAQNAATQVFKEYPEQGFRWVELTTPKNMKLPEGYSIIPDPITNRKTGVVDTNSYRLADPDGRLVGWGKTEEEAVSSGLGEKLLADALKYEGETMGHCVGGYCPDVLEGRSRIFSLRDRKGQPHVTVEVKPGKDKTGLLTAEELPPEELADMKARNVYDPGFMYRFNEELGRHLPELGPFEPDIIQIKGKANKAPKEEYLPFVQDFVRSQKWGRVGDLGNTGLMETKGFLHGGMDPRVFEAVRKELGEYATMDDIVNAAERHMAGLGVKPGARGEGFAAGGLVGLHQRYAAGGAVVQPAQIAVVPYDEAKIDALASALTA